MDSVFIKHSYTLIQEPKVGQDGMESKHVLASKTNNISLSIILVALFKVYQSYDGGGVAAISEADIAILAGGIALLINRIKDKHSQPLHFKKKRNV